MAALRIRRGCFASVGAFLPAETSSTPYFENNPFANLDLNAGLDAADDGEAQSGS